MAISRVTLPQEFFDITSAKMLVQPEPQYLFANMVFASTVGAELRAQGIEVGVRGAFPASGASAMSVQEMQLQLASSPFGSAIMVANELGQKGVGHTVKFNRPVFSGGGYTEASRTIAQSSSISTTPVELAAQEQVSITIKRVAGPYDSTNSRVAPYAIDRADAGRSVHSLASIVGTHLYRDRTRYLDTVIAALFNSASTSVVRAGGLTSDASFPASGSQPFDLSMVLRGEEALSNANIPRFSDGTYLSIISPTQMRQLREDPDYQNQAKEDREFNIVTGMKATRVGDGVRIMQSSTVPTDTATVPGQTIYRGMMFGPEAVGFGIDEACRVASANEDNYGETAKVIWISYEGSALLDERFICSLRSI